MAGPEPKGFFQMEDKVGCTRNQSIAAGAIRVLGYEMVVPEPGGKVGGPQQYTITDDALDALKGKKIEVVGDGTTKVLS